MGRVIGVQPKEICRVPLLCKCCSEVPSNAFQIAASRASHMMQMQEMERLRQILERHVSAHLDIHWSMPSQRLYGSVPVGPLLSSVTLLKQLVVPAMSIEVGVNGIPYVSEDEIPVGIGEIVDLNVRLISSMDGPGSFSGVLQLRCYQDMLNGSEFIDRRNAMVILNHRSLPFTVFHESVERKRADTISVGGDYMPASSEHNNDSFHGETFVRGSFSMKFSVLFRFEGVMKVKPVILKNDGTPAFSDDELFCSAVTMNVVTKTA
ncbi:hypothetical protein AB6A40_010185 [Gnathostoma spinigerum]|uniref:Uncharacterized protein n=1 Tax=Gnathostoma spinigerum TaxID=75299 RepID=A0ABD6EVU3_9BILA